MGNVSTRLAPHRVAYCFRSVDNGAGYAAHLGAAWGAVARAVPWKTLDAWSFGIVPVFTGRILDRPMARGRFGYDFVEGVLFGLPSARIAELVAQQLGRLARDGTLGVWRAPPPPDDPALSFPLTEFIAPGTVVVLGANLTGVPRGFDPDIGLQVVSAKNEDEEIALAMSAGDVDTLAPRLVRLFSENLRLWLNEPRADDTTERQLAHAQELVWAGAPTLAAVVAGRALERELQRRVRTDPDDGKLHGMMLGKLIDTAKKTGKIAPQDATRMQTFKAVRNRCAHAIVDGAEIDVAAEVELRRMVR
jgi:hypothetical protein